MKTKVSMQYLDALSNMKYFTRAELLETMRKYGMEISDAVFKVTLQKLLYNCQIARVGRNAYCVPKENVRPYIYNYSELACDIARIVHEDFPYLDYTILELVQLNAFVNHQLAHNIIFLSVEADIKEFVFDSLKEKYPGKVLIDPTPDIFHQYWYDNMIVIEKLVSEAPKGCTERWHTRLEKLLVDLLADPLLLDSISASELPTIYEGAFERYIIDESCLFRYAKRRGTAEKIKKFIKDNTAIQLRME